MNNPLTRISRQGIQDIFGHTIMSSPLSLHIEKRNYRTASHAEIEAALSSFEPGEWVKDFNDCADMAARCLSRLISKLPARAVFLCKIPGHCLCGFLDVDGRIQVIEPAHVNSMHEWLYQWPGAYSDNLMTMVFCP